MRAVVVGAGLQGVPIAWAMENKLGFETILTDIDAYHLSMAKNKIDKMGGKLFGTCAHPQEVIKNSDIVISAAPYFANPDIAWSCLDHGVKYCDLGGNPEVSDSINKTYKEANKSVCFTDLGLAPGYVSILAEMGYVEASKTKQVENVEMYCGGLPLNSHINKLRYALTFSIAGLYNEYVGDCEVLIDGVETTRPALHDLKMVDIGGYPEAFESFNTKGGAVSTISVMKERGVKNCRYQTLRWPGHHKYLSFMLNECKMDLDTFAKCIEKACPTAKQVGDIILVKVVVDDWVATIVVNQDLNWTAMQKATAFPAAAVASLMADGIFDDKPSVVYADIPAEPFNERLNLICPEVAL
jgi:saccharopine dehydrogenase-like NADP-dependent oxidoreductase